MAEQLTELRRINWSECFSFTHIFRTFRLAIHPSKLGLALAGLILTALVGMVLDAVWCATDCRPVEGEVNAFWQVPDIDSWRDQMKQLHAERLQAVYERLGQAPPKNLAADFTDDPGDAVDEALEQLEEGYEKSMDRIAEEERREDVRRSRIAKMASDKNALHDEIESLRPQGVFAGFRSFETAAVRQAIDAARGLNFLGRIGEILNARSQSEAMLPVVHTGPEGIGVLACVVLMLRGVQWLVAEHWFFALLFLLLSLAIWSLFGGAVCRMAALNVARDERISPKDALRFAYRKFLGFLTAPLLPVGLIAVIGVCIFVGGMFTAIPYVGDILGGVGMGLALLGGFVTALVAIGAVGGGALMWPTIAVEGSDSFDAMSRSYSYLYSRPWRTGFYAAVAAVYGALCYLFARFFVLVLLKATRLFVGWGICVFPTYRPGTGLDGGKKIDVIWPHPTFEDLRLVSPPFGAEGWGDSVAAFLIGLWVLLVVGLLCAFLISFFFSGSTIIYYLLRRQVDATDIEDVYVEEEEEEAGEAPEEEAEPAAEPAPGAPELRSSVPPSAPGDEPQAPPASEESGKAPPDDES